MTTLWAKMVDTDGDGNLEVVQVHDEDPAGIWHPDFLDAWRQVPGDATIGSVLETSTGKWWTGADWLEKKLSEAAPENAPPIKEAKPFKGQVTKIKLKEAGANYETPPVRDQFDSETGRGLIAEVTYDPVTEKAVSVELINGGYDYEVGQTFQIKVGMGRDWDRKNPTYTVLEVEEVYSAADAVVFPRLD